MAREWERALERQLALIDWFGSGNGAVWLNLFSRLYRSAPAPELQRKRLLELLGHADTYYVSDEMTSLVERAAKSIGDPVLERHVPFTPQGFVYFQRPVTIWWSNDQVWGSQSAHGRRPLLPPGSPHLVESAYTPPHGKPRQVMQMRGLLWSYEPRSVTGIVDGQMDLEPRDGVSWFILGSDTQLDTYSDWMEDPHDSFRKDLLRTKIADTVVEGGEPPSESELDAWAARIDELCWEHGIERYRDAPDGLRLIEASSWSAGQVWDELTEEEWEEGLEAGRDVHEMESSAHVWFQVARVRRFMFSLWSIMAQPIATPVSETPNRDYRRRWERAVGTPPNYGDVRVVTLRRSQSGGGPEETDEEWGREWSHRWVVRGHWRKQWYPSEGVHRMKWIDAFVKGPDDKPLIIKDSVYEVVR